MLHHTEQTRTYPCPSCGGQLEFHIASQRLMCPHCGNSADIVTDPRRVVAEHDLRSTMDELHALADTAGPPQRHGDNEHGDKEVVCQSCGGHTTFTGTLTATRCPYCATPIQRDDVHTAPARLGVDGVLPFQVDEKHARISVEKWVHGRWFAPTEFKTYRETGSFASVYAAYFTYDADTHTWYQGRRGDDYQVTVGSGDNRRTETRTRWTPVSGEVHDTFDDLAVLANDGFEHDKVSALEPWPTADAKPYSPEYIAGHLCRTYDHDAEQTLPQAQRRMEKVIQHSVRRDIGGDRQHITQTTTDWLSLSFKHLLLPIWLLTVIYANRPFQVFINGVTGEVQGQRPWSKVKIAVAVVVGILVLITVLTLLQLLRRR